MGVKWKKTEEKNEFVTFWDAFEDLLNIISNILIVIVASDCLLTFLLRFQKKSYLSKMTFFALFFDIITASCHKEDFYLNTNIHQNGSISIFFFLSQK